jgi:ectoine hydroxylase-related dioxygenase (phytanoyl-CoA dioxygenase family)
LSAEELVPLTAAYDRIVAAASPDDFSRNRSSVRVYGLADQGPEFERIFRFSPLLAAAHELIGQPIELSTMHARSVLPHSPAQHLHVDFGRQPDGWPMLGFIMMLDDFKRATGATRFVAGSHRAGLPDAQPPTLATPYKLDVACGPAGSMILYNGSVWHGFGQNRTANPRRSVQGAYRRISPSAGRSGFDAK